MASFLVSLSQIYSNTRSFTVRPQRAKFSNILMVLFFACTMVYLIFCGIWLATKAVHETRSNLKPDDPSTTKLIFLNPVFRNLIVSTAGTFGLCILSGIIALDFLHIFTSFIQYLLFLPSYINILFAPYK